MGVVVIAAGVGLVVVGVGGASVALHALLLGRLPGRWLGRGVRRPRLWGAGAALIMLSWSFGSPSLLAVGAGLVALGYVVKAPW